MSEVLLLGVDSEKKHRSSRPWTRLTWIALGALAVVAVIELVFQLLIAPNMRIEHVAVQSDFPISDEQLLAIAGIERKEYYFSVQSDAIEASLESYPVVGEAEVRKVFPDTLEIVLRQRKPLALAFGSGEGRMVPVAFDAEGVIFQVGRSVGQWDLPVVSGLRFKPVLGLELPPRLEPFLEQMQLLRENAPELYDLISEIKIYSTNEVDYELVLYPLGYNTRITLGENLDGRSFKYALMILEVLRDQGLDVAELDFRSGDVVYRLKEG